MKTIYMILVLAFAAVSAAYAADSAPCLSGCTAPPMDVSWKFKFDDAEKYFNQATLPTMEQLEGEWTLVGSTKRFGFPADDEKRDPNEYAANGLKNNDGTLLFLSFQKQETFDGSIRETVSLFNWGSENANQGPYLIQFDSSAGSACFSQWGYGPKGDTRLNHAGYYDLSCRLMPHNSSKLLCAFTVRILDRDAVERRYWEFDGQVISYRAFVRK